MNPLIIANWKMNMLTADIEPFLAELSPTASRATANIVIAAPFTLLSALHTHRIHNVELAAQDLSTHTRGAYTGEIAGEHLRDVGVTMVIIGHSERRHYHNETTSIAREKILRALETKITPIYCVGESEEEKHSARTLDVLTEQLTEGLNGVPQEQRDTMVIAYEPRWAIGTGVMPTAIDIENAHTHIRSHVGARTRIVYGGSVTMHNAAALMHIPHVNGLLIGGASLRVHDFVRIIQAV